MPMPLLVGYKINISTEIAARWRAHPVPSAHVVDSAISTALDSKIVNLRAYAHDRLVGDLSVGTSTT